MIKLLVTEVFELQYDANKSLRKLRDTVLRNIASVCKTIQYIYFQLSAFGVS